MNNPHSRSRRIWLQQAGVLLVGSYLSPLAQSALSTRVAELLGPAPMLPERVTLEMPALAENGNSVALKVAVDYPMDNDNYVKHIHIISEKNPNPEVVRFDLSPESGLATVQTRIRLADSQTIIAIAELSDGTRLSGMADIVVTEAACLDFLI